MAEDSEFTAEQLQQILVEIANYQIDLAEDPTLPELGTQYLQKCIAQCRSFLNRTQYYLQKVGKQEKELKLQVKLKELDIDFKIAEKLADDPVVRQQPSISDRRALATAQLKEEHKGLAKLKIGLLDAQETLKLLKMKYGDLRSSNTDIKSQRQLIKDDMQAWSEGGEGYTRPQAQQDGTMADGMSAPVTNRIDPQDILDPDKRPDDLPEPRDAVHAKQIAEFFEQTSSEAPAATPPVSYDDLLKV